MKRAVVLLCVLSACGVEIEDDPGVGTSTLRVEADYTAWRAAWATRIFVDDQGGETRGQSPVTDAKVKVCGRKNSLGCNSWSTLSPDRAVVPGTYTFSTHSRRQATRRGELPEIAPSGIRWGVTSELGDFEGSIGSLGRLDLVAPVVGGDTHTVSAGSAIEVIWTEENTGRAAADTVALFTTATLNGQRTNEVVTFSEIELGARSGLLSAPTAPGTYSLIVETGRSLKPEGVLPGSVLRAWRRDEAILVVTP